MCQPLYEAKNPNKIIKQLQDAIFVVALSCKPCYNYLHIWTQAGSSQRRASFWCSTSFFSPGACTYHRWLARGCQPPRQKQLPPTNSHVQVKEMTMHILWLDDPGCHDPQLVGGKAAQLARLAAGFDVPYGFCVPAPMLAHLDADDSFPASLQAAITTAYQALASYVG